MIQKINNELVYLLLQMQMQIRAEQGRKEYLRQREEMQAWQDILIVRPMKEASHESIENPRKARGISDQTSWQQPTSKG